MTVHNEIAYFIDFSIHEIPYVAYIAYEVDGIIYTDSEKTYKFIKKDHPELQVKYFNTVEKIKQHMVQSGVKVIIYPDYHIRFFKNLTGVRHVQIFHGLTDKKYHFIKDVLNYDLFFIPGNDDYKRYEERGLLKKGTGILIVYPKLDRVFRGEIKKDEELIKLKLAPIKKTVLYASTWLDRALNSSWK